MNINELPIQPISREHDILGEYNPWESCRVNSTEQFRALLDAIDLATVGVIVVFVSVK